MTKIEVFYLIYKKEIERSDSLILVTLGNLVHFSHSFIMSYCYRFTGAGALARACFLTAS